MSLFENRLLPVGLFTLWFCVVVVVVLVPSAWLWSPCRLKEDLLWLFLETAGGAERSDL